MGIVSEAFLSAGKKSREKRTIEAIENYYKNPNHCLECGLKIDLREGEKPFRAKRKKFCSHSCAAVHSNKNRERKPWSEDARDVASQKMQDVWETRRADGETIDYSKRTWQQKYSDSSHGKCKKCGTSIAFRKLKAKKRYAVKDYCDKCRLELRRLHSAIKMGADESWIPVEERTVAQLKEHAGKNWWSYRIPIQKHARLVYERSDRPKHCVVCGYSKHYQVCHKKPVTDFPDTATVKEINDPKNLIGLCPTHHWEFDHGLLVFNGDPAPRVSIDPSLLDETIEVLTNLSQIINVCREEWKSDGNWSSWDESESQKSDVLAKLYALRTSETS